MPGQDDFGFGSAMPRTGGVDLDALLALLGGGGARPVGAASLLPLLTGPQFPQAARGGALSGGAAPAFDPSRAVLASAFAGNGSQSGSGDFLSQLLKLLGGMTGGDGAGATGVPTSLLDGTVANFGMLD
jgi:hypothetical protein